MVEETDVKNELTLSGVNELQTGMFGASKIKKATSLDVNNEEDMTMLLNSMQECENKLNDFTDKEIKVIGCYATEREVDSYNEDTGEAVTRKKHTLMLFDENGVSYVTGSNSCYMSFMDIVAIKGMPTRENPITLKPIKTNAKEKGHFYLKLKIVTNK